MDTSKETPPLWTSRQVGFLVWHMGLKYFPHLLFEVDHDCEDGELVNVDVKLSKYQKPEFKRVKGLEFLMRHINTTTPGV